MIRNYNLIRSILSEPWFMSVSEAQNCGVLLTGVFSPHLEIDPMTKDEAAGISYVQPVHAAASKSMHNIGVIRITGALTKYDTWCAYGMESYRRMIRDFKEDETISAIVLDIYSPGGTVVGTEELGDEIRNSDKPIIAFVSDMAFSAAYWIAASCREIIANNTTAQVGSVGVICSYMDLTEYYKKEGIKIHEILPDQSKDKRKEEQLIKEGKYDLTKERLGVLADKFHGVVRAGRPAVTDDQLTGRTYYAQDVLGSMIDSIGPFETALVRAADLASENSNIKPINNKESMSKTQFIHLAKAAGVDSLESADGSIHLTAEMASALEQALTAGAEGQTTAPAVDVDVLKVRITALESSIKAKDEKIAELGQDPGATGAAVVPETDSTTANDFSAVSFAEAMAEARDFAKTIKG